MMTPGRQGRLAALASSKQSDPQKNDTSVVVVDEPKVAPVDTILQDTTGERDSSQYEGMDFGSALNDSLIIDSLENQTTVQNSIENRDSIAIVQRDTLSKVTQIPKNAEQKEAVSPPTPYVKKSVFMVPSINVRIAIAQRVKRFVLYAPDQLDVRDNRGNGASRKYGRLLITGIRKKGSTTLVDFETLAKEGSSFALPCTMSVSDPVASIECEEHIYRGGLILIPDEKETFTVVNYLPVEEYLQGVVALELGKVDSTSYEALKAQAVAARTYAYKKIIERRGKQFDMVNSISDQVYGGVTAEYPLSNRAVKETKRMVMIWGDSLIYSYYHSTCGGKTANIEDVWGNKPALPYLRSISDQDRSKKAFCSISSQYSWSETYTISKLSAIVRKFAPGAFPQEETFKGQIKRIILAKNRSCGRVTTCQVSNGTRIYTYSGDKIRYLFRRQVSRYPIMRSINFDIEKPDQDRIVFRGKGNGHGVGMCQMGAIARARAGQSYKTILLAYYTGISILPVEVEAR